MKWGYHAVYEASFRSAIELARSLSFDFVQFDLNIPHFYVHEFTSRELKDLELQSHDNDITVTFHAPGDFVGLTMDIEPIRSAYIDHWKKVIDVAEELGSHHITFHPLAPPSFKRADTGSNDFENDYFGYYRDVFAENVSILEEHAESVWIAVENHKFGASVRAGIETVFNGESRVGLTLDIPKLYLPDGNVDGDALSIFEKYQSRIVEIHVHDLIPGKMQHLEVGTGVVSFAEYARFLSDEYAWKTVEVRPADAAARSRDNLILEMESL